MTCGTQIGGIKEIWRRHILWFCVPILNKLSQLYALDLIQLLSVFPPGCLASWHRVFFVRVIQLEGAISPSGVAWREEPNQAGPWGGKFQVKILVPKKCDFEIKKLQSQTLAEHPGNQAFNECFLKLETVKLRKKKKTIRITPKTSQIGTYSRRFKAIWQIEFFSGNKHAWKLILKGYPFSIEPWLL